MNVKQDNFKIPCHLNFNKIITEYLVLLLNSGWPDQRKKKENNIKWGLELLNDVIFPALSEEAVIKTSELRVAVKIHGPLGNKSYAAGKNRRDYVRRKPGKPWKQTPARVAQINRFKDVISLWKSITPEEKSEWNRRAAGTHKSGLNLYIQHQLNQQLKR